MTPTRRTALIVGALFVLTFVSAIVGAALYAPVLGNPEYVTTGGADAQIRWGAVCEIVLCIANIGTAVVLFPILRRQNEGVALGYVAARVVESVLIAVGILSILAVVTLRQEVAAGTGDGGASATVASALVAVHDWTFLLGPGFLAGFGNGLLLGYLMFRSRLVPRGLALFGLLGGPLMALSGIAVLFGFYAQSSVVSGLLTLPEIIWEGALGLWLIFRGFRASPLLHDVRRTEVAPAL